MSLSLKKYFLLKILLFSCYLQENTFFAFAEDDINEKLTCNFEKNSLCNYRLIGAKERYNNEKDIEGQYLEIKMSETKEIFVESPLINVEENGHNFSFYLSYLSPNKKLNVYADDKLIHSKRYGSRYRPSWREAKFELPIGKYKIRIQIPQLYWSRYEYTRFDSFAFDRNRIAEQLDCNFDKNDTCKYRVGSHMGGMIHKWTTQKYASPGLGYYLYAGPKECKGSGTGFTTLRSPFFDVPEKGHFISFYYYSERSIGLGVEVYFGRSFTLMDPYRNIVPALNTWHKAKFDLPDFSFRYRITIRSECLRTGNGSFAIDSIAVDREPERPKYPPIWN